jgi:uncharacterized phiE125 gp8 family phage protein
MLELVTPPSREDIFKLVDVAKLKEAKRLTNNREDAFIRDCILDAWAFIDGPDAKCRRAVLPQRWAFTATQFDQNSWDFPVHGVRAVQSITYYDATNTLTTVDPANYWLNGDSMSPRLFFSAGWSFPVVYDRPDAIRVVFDAGWPDALQVPRGFRRALQLLAAHLYDNREATFGDNRVSVVSRRIDLGLDAFLQRYVVPIDFTGGQRAICRRAHLLL